mmetsp:Transcript_5790/g.12655  ORF Transcript_5790/g.12655 Transcript_5790/m.12655 type:complete len:292 (+) Transcript_5790:358-1233(+)
MEPEPMPMRSASTPHLIKFFACVTQTTLPPTTCSCGKFSLINLTMPSWYVESPCDESMTTTSTPASASAFTRSLSSGRVCTDAPTSSRLSSPLDASGKSLFLRMSLREMRATSSRFLLTTGSLPFFESIRSWFASWREQPTSATTRSVVITSITGVLLSLTKSWSRVVTMPTSRPPSAPFSVTGMPEKPCLALIMSTSARVAFGGRQKGSRMKPFSYRFTRRTSAHCSSMVLLQWMMPRPPKSAMWIAICASVTVSIGLEMKGRLSLIFFVTCVCRLTSSAAKLMWPGRMM